MLASSGRPTQSDIRGERLGVASATYPPNTLLIHVYVSDVDDVFKRALAAGGTEDQAPQQRPGDPDRRGSFKDFAGNTWAIATQR
jgi:uncharacterized glyoxalase superfamily protein PhnB